MSGEVKEASPQPRRNIADRLLTRHPLSNFALPQYIINRKRRQEDISTGFEEGAVAFNDVLTPRKPLVIFRRKCLLYLFGVVKIEVTEGNNMVHVVVFPIPRTFPYMANDG